MKGIAIVDYDRGNLRSVQKGFERVGCEAVVTRSAREIRDARAVVLPGVGAFADCMANLDRLGLVDPILEAIRCGKPFLGICLGLQLLFSESEEFGLTGGLDVFKGRVAAFPARTLAAQGLKIPHMGWNTIRIVEPSPLFESIPDGSSFYFVHSYYVCPEDRSVASTETEYGVVFVSSIHKENVFATQFHPEKSQRLGLKILENFGRLRW
jgi:glutamine amidotransferase